MAETLLTIKDIMARLKISRATVYRLIDQGELHPIKIGKSVRFREADLDAIINGSA